MKRSDQTTIAALLLIFCLSAGNGTGKSIATTESPLAIRLLPQ